VEARLQQLTGHRIFRREPLEGAPRADEMLGDARLHRRQDVLAEEIPHASDVVLRRAGTTSVRTEERRAILRRESLQGEDEEPSSLPLADVPLRGAADSGLDDTGAEEVVAILERDREISREGFERRTVLGRGAGRNRGGRRRAEVSPGAPVQLRVRGPRAR